MGERPEFRDELAALLNRRSRENVSDTPDFVLAQFLETCLAAFDAGVNARSAWYGRHDAPGRAALSSPPVEGPLIVTVGEYVQAPLDCPKCGSEHIDRGEWATKPHHKHLCAECGNIWRVDAYIFGVARVPAPPVEGGAPKWHAIHLYSEGGEAGPQQIVVAIEPSRGRWVELIRYPVANVGGVISHIVEPSGIERLVSCAPPGSAAPPAAEAAQDALDAGPPWDGTATLLPAAEAACERVAGPHDHRYCARPAAPPVEPPTGGVMVLVGDGWFYADVQDRPRSGFFVVEVGHPHWFKVDLQLCAEGTGWRRLTAEELAARETPMSAKVVLLTVESQPKEEA